MERFLLQPVVGTLAALITIFNTLFWTIPLLTVGFVKLIIPIPAWQRMCVRWIEGIIWIWMDINNVFIRLLLPTEWDISGVEGLTLDGSYLISCNHQTWLDIPVLARVFSRRISFPRFFLKQQLIWVPVVGFVAWSLDMPFMKRYSREFLEKNPELRGKDLETTRMALEKYKDMPIAILNFLEGTRFSEKKREQQQSPYRHLLNPRAGGVAFVLAAMGEKFDTILDVSIIYPGAQPSLWNFMSRRIPRIVVRVRQMDIPEGYLHGDYMNDPVFRNQFQAWVRELWHNKDEFIEQTLKEVPNKV